MDRIIFHIGPHKTGTTYLQKLLAAHAADLANFDVCYDVSQESSGIAHHDIAKLLVGSADDKETARRSIEELASSAATVILSSENFSRVANATWQDLSRHLSDRFEVSFVCYMRSRSTAVYSWWQELIKHGHYLSFAEYLCQELLHPYQNQQINILAVLESVSLADKIDKKIVIYDNLLEQKIDLADHFLTRVVGLKLGEPIGNGQLFNQSFGEVFIETLRCLNLISARKKIPPSHHFRNKLLALITRDNNIQEHMEDIRRNMAPYLKEIELSPLDRNFADIDRALEQKYREAIINPYRNEPYCVANWPRSTMRKYIDAIALTDLQLWSKLWKLHDAVSAADVQSG